MFLCLFSLDEAEHAFLPIPRAAAEINNSVPPSCRQEGTQPGCTGAGGAALCSAMSSSGPQLGKSAWMSASDLQAGTGVRDSQFPHLLPRCPLARTWPCPEVLATSYGLAAQPGKAQCIHVHALILNLAVLVCTYICLLDASFLPQTEGIFLG